MFKIITFLLLWGIPCTGCSADRATGGPAADIAPIQVRIDASTNGDTILVEPGTYFERINYWGKAVYVKSIAGPDSTVIDGERKGCVVDFSGCADTFSVLDGFTVTNGNGMPISGQRRGGGIYGYVVRDSSSCKLLNCIIRSNRAGEGTNEGIGGGVYIRNGVFVMRGCTVRDNTANSTGGGLKLGVSGHIYSNRILNNQATGYDDGWQQVGGWGGGMYLSSCDDLLIENNLFKGNTVSRPEEEYWYPRAGALMSGYGAPEIKNNRFIGNGGGIEGGAMYIADGSEGTIVAHNLFFESSAGDFWDSGRGGAFCCHGHGGVLLINNTFLRNGAYQGRDGEPYGGSIDYQKSGSGVFNNIIAETLSGRYAAALGRPSHSNNCFWDNVDGDTDDPEPNAVFADPMFKDEQYHLHPGSPCIDAGIIMWEDDPYCLELPDIGARESCTDFIIPFYNDTIPPYRRNNKR